METESRGFDLERDRRDQETEVKRIQANITMAKEESARLETQIERCTKDCEIAREAFTNREKDLADEKQRAKERIRQLKNEEETREELLQKIKILEDDIGELEKREEQVADQNKFVIE